jgi:hypothetical protein
MKPRRPCKHLNALGVFSESRPFVPKTHPTFSQALSALVKSIRLRRVEDALYWLVYLDTFKDKASRFRTARRILIGSAEDGHSVAVMEKVADQFSALARLETDVVHLAAEMVRISKIPNWWHPDSGGPDYIYQGMLGETIKTVLRTIHWPTLDNHIQELPLLVFDPIFHFWEGFNGVVTSSLFHIYDPVLASEIQRLHRQWGVTVSFGIHYMPKGNGSYIFVNPGHRPLTSEQERDWERIQKAALALTDVKKKLLDHIRRAFEEVDIERLSNEAWSEYLAFQNRFSLK